MKGNNLTMMSSLSPASCSLFAPSHICHAKSFGLLLIAVGCFHSSPLQVEGVLRHKPYRQGAVSDQMAASRYYASSSGAINPSRRRAEYWLDQEGTSDVRFREGFSPNLEADYPKEDNQNELEFYSKTFYERHGLLTPPLLSRRLKLEKQRLQQERIMQGTQEEDVESNHQNVSINGNDKTGDESTLNSTEEETDELEQIIYSTKTGTDYPTLLRQDILFNNDPAGNQYDRHAYPWEYVWYNQTVKTGLPIEFSINFHRVFSVDVINPVLDLIVWLRTEWVDPRLTWRPEEYGNLTKIWFWIGDGGAGGETSEIWTPGE